MIQESLLLTKREIEVINKKLQNKSLTQQDSNYLSKFVRPKLREMNQIDSKLLLNKLEYNQKTPRIESKIKQIILKNLKDVISITIYGSAIYNNYHNYKDIDVLVTIKNKFWKKVGDKYSKIVEIKKQAKKKGLNLDLRVYRDKAVYHSYSWNISLIYQLKDSKTIYGILKLPSKIEIPKLEFRMKVDYSMFLEEDYPTGEELYKAIRNLWLINLLLDKIIDNIRLNQIVKEELGESLASRLKSNKCSKTDKKIAWIYLEKMVKDTLKRINEGKWEKIRL